MGGGIPHADFINGVRFVDKTDFHRGKIIMFRMEVWIRKNLDENDIQEMKQYLIKTLECESITIKNITL